MIRGSKMHRMEIEASSDNENDESSDGELRFKLRTPAGEFNFNLNLSEDEVDYVMLLRTMFGAMISLNPDIERKEFQGKIWEALISLGGEGDEDDRFAHGIQNDWRQKEDANEEDEDDLAQAMRAEEEARREVQAVEQHISTLPDAKEFSLNILHYDDDAFFKVNNLISKITDFSEAKVAKIMNRERFSLPADKAKELYVKLRNLGVLLVLGAKQKGKKKTTIKTVKTKQGLKKRLPILNGREKLHDADALIAN